MLGYDTTTNNWSITSSTGDYPIFDNTKTNWGVAVSRIFRADTCGNITCYRKHNNSNYGDIFMAFNAIFPSISSVQYNINTSGSGGSYNANTNFTPPVLTNNYLVITSSLGVNGNVNQRTSREETVSIILSESSNISNCDCRVFKNLTSLSTTVSGANGGEALTWILSL